MVDSWYYALSMNGVPSDDIKVWQITRTSTSLVVVCNGVTVVNFNFATDYRNGYNRCHELWSRQSNTIRFNYPHGMYGYSGHLQIRIINDGKNKINIYRCISLIPNSSIQNGDRHETKSLPDSVKWYWVILDTSKGNL